MGFDLTAPEGLCVSGLCHDGDQTVALISPDEPGFWPIFTASPELADGQPDPMDRWSMRVIGDWALRINARAVFPSQGPPYPPFRKWAHDSDSCWASVTGLTLHRRTGLMVSFRGALVLDGRVPLRPKPARPCEACDKPCLSACPVDAMSSGYDLDACHGWLGHAGGVDCMSQGCRIRRACPISTGCGRLPEQSAWHMRQFHP